MGYCIIGMKYHGLSISLYRKSLEICTVFIPILHSVKFTNVKRSYNRFLHAYLDRSRLAFRVKSGNFGHQVNPDIHLQTLSGNPAETDALYDPSHQDFHNLLS